MENPDSYLFWNTWYNRKAQLIGQKLLELEAKYGGFSTIFLSETTSDKSDSLHEYLENEGFSIHFCPTTVFGNGASEGLAVASRHVIENVDFIKLSTARGIRGVKNRHLAMVKRDNLTIASAHLSYPTGFNHKAIKTERALLFQALPSERALFGGDFNTVVGAGLISELKNYGYVKLHDEARIATCRTRVGKLTIGPGIELDHALATADLSGQTKLTIEPESYPSNHYPLVVTVS